MPRAGLDPQKRPCWLVHSAMFCSARPEVHGTCDEAEELDETVPMVRLTGADALEKAAFLKPIRREERYLRSSLQALHDPAHQGDAFLARRSANVTLSGDGLGCYCTTRHCLFVPADTLVRSGHLISPRWLNAHVEHMILYISGHQGFLLAPGKHSCHSHVHREAHVDKR